MKEILINQLFAGAYLSEATNIGHEVINLFKDDNDDNYLFITPHGKFNGHDVDKVIFVQNIKARETMEVVLVAEGLSETDTENVKKIYYAGVNIVDIFSRNVYRGETDIIDFDVYAPYKANSVRIPAKGKRIIITVDEKYVCEDENAVVILLDSSKSKIVGQGMRTYLSEVSYPVIYDKILELINDKTLWDINSPTQKLMRDGSNSRSDISFLEIIRKENDELIMSNLLAYYFNYNHKMFVRFAKEILGIKDFDVYFEIIRESMNNIDLWIQGTNSIVVIENKIKSGLNGVKTDGTNQLNKYYNYTQDNSEGKQTYYYLFEPNYSNIEIEDDIIKDKFKVVYYSDIYGFFRNNAAEYINDKYFADFLMALQNQTMTDAELRFSIMRSRFLEKINQR